MRRPPPFVQLEMVVVTVETKRAIFCTLADGLDLWVPRSLLHEDSEVKSYGQEGLLIVAGWYAWEQGLEGAVEYLGRSL